MDWKWKETVTTVSENVFPGISYKTDYKLQGKEVNSNLPLQMATYFNVVFAPVWVIIIILFLNDNFQNYNELYRLLIITVIVTVFLVEILRLYLEYEGNLRDKIPDLAGFWMLSFFLQLPLQGFLLFNPYIGMNVLEVIVQSVMFILLLIELISGYCALKYTAVEQATYFRITKSRANVSLKNAQGVYKGE